MALFVCLYRNIKGLSAALFVLCHPVDLLALNQKEKISFYMLLQNSKRWYTVITDKRLSRAKGRRNPSLFFPLFCFFLPGRELRENSLWFLWGSKAQKPRTQIKMQMCLSVCGAAREGEESTRAPGRTRRPSRAPWQAMPEVPFRLSPYTLKQTHQSTAPGSFCFVKLLWKCPGNHESVGNFPSCQFSPCSTMLLLPIQYLQKTHLFWPKAVFQTPGWLEVTRMNCEVLCEVSFFLLQTNWWKIQRWVEQAQKLMDRAVVWWKLGDVGTRLREHVWMMCLGVSLQQATKSGSKCDSLLTVWGKQRSQLPAGLDTGTAASGTPGIHDIGVLSWFKPSTCAKEAPAGVTKCNWGYWSMTQLPTLGVSLTLLRLGGYWEPMVPAPHFPPKGSARAGTSRELPKCTAWSVLTFQYLHVPISDSNPVGTIMSLCQHISPTPSPCSSFPSDYFQVLWDCF